MQWLKVPLQFETSPMLEALKTDQIFARIGLEITNSALEVRDGREDKTFGHVLLFSVI